MVFCHAEADDIKFQKEAHQMSKFVKQAAK
jgi:hypothetical protein